MPSSKPVPLRKLGSDGLVVPALGFGLMGLSFAYGTAPPDEERFALLDRAVELGATFWDTADIYGDSEELVGRWLKRTGKRDQIVLATKFGLVNTGSMGGWTVKSSAAYAREACEKSLARLGVESIDLYYNHRLDPETPIEETMRALAELKAEGKIKHIGLCEPSSTTLRRAVAIAPVAAVQVEYSPFDREVETAASTNLLATCRALGVAVVCSSPLGRGLLTGTLTSPASLSDPRDGRGGHMPRFMGENLEANARVVARFADIAARKGCTPAQLALAWLLRQGEDVVPIPGTKKVKYLEENWGALGVELSADEEKEIREFAESAEMAGGRAQEVHLAFAWQDTKEETKA